MCDQNLHGTICIEFLGDLPVRQVEIRQIQQTLKLTDSGHRHLRNDTGLFKSKLLFC